jgi:hypothetical protein
VNKDQIYSRNILDLDDPVEVPVKKRISVLPWIGSATLKSQYDGVIASVGYETRSSFIAKTLNMESNEKYACAFDNNKVHSYFDNLTWYASQGFLIQEQGETEFSSWCEDVFSRLLEHARERTVRVLIDISSMTRFRIAALLAAIFDSNGDFDVDFLYAPSRFNPPTDEDEAPIVVCKPVMDKWAGWSMKPDNPSLALFGLGYESDRALGALEYIEPGSVWAFIPTGGDQRYDRALLRANKTFLESVPRSHLFEYGVAEPVDCFTKLEALVYGNLESTKPILVPFGPKIFALNCLLVACVYFPKVAVWRVSAGVFAPPQDKFANGQIVGVRVQFGGF